MEAVKILTTDVPEWVDAHISPPNSGDRVQGLTIGGCQVSLVWTSESIKFIDAWHKHLKVPQSVKDRQMARYTEDIPAETLKLFKGIAESDKFSVEAAHKVFAKEKV